MHEENIDLMVEETKRLLRLQIELLENMGKDPQVVTGRLSQSEQTFTQEDMPRYLEVLREEFSKVENLALVLAIVGTLKAGKSTTINAIVGTEVLPSRNRPMTALPTLIRHKPGKAEPVLILGKVEPLRKLAEKLRGNPGFKKLEKKDHFRDLIGELSSGAMIQQRYEGASNIYKCLKVVNDLVRICSKLGEEFPFGEYDEFHEMPVIEVEFYHLTESGGSPGRLVLLDTPGPNEQGQLHLEEMMKGQLDKASAIMAVLDFTQLESKADAQIRNELMKRAHLMRGRFYAMVNKFDAKDRNSCDDPEKVKRQVASDLLRHRDYGSVMPVDKIFPVSALQAFLANRALRELNLNGKLPDPDDAPWVEDFGKKAFGEVRWENQIQDPREVEDRAQGIWKKSLFGPPLQVIKAAHSQASILALDSATSKLDEYADKVSNLTNLRLGAMNKQIEIVKEQIRDLEGDIDVLDGAERNARSNLETMLKATKKTLLEQADRVRDEAKKVLNRYFDEGRTLLQEKDEAEKRAKRRRRKPKFLISKFLGISETPGAAQHFDPDEDRITFSDRKSAKDFLNKMDGEIRKVMGAAQRSIRKSMEDEQKKFDDSFRETKNSLQERLSKIASRAKDDGFKVWLRVPGRAGLRVNLIPPDILDGVVEGKEHEKSVRRHRDTWWGDLCSWLGTEEWGTEVVTEIEKKYEISIKRVRAQVTCSVQHAFKELAKVMGRCATGPQEDRISSLFAKVRKNVEQIRGDLICGLNDRELEAEKKTKLISRLAEFQKRNDDSEADIKGLWSDVKKAKEVVGQ